jgi:glycosyltransferase involved in cell wall biosynthesis
LYAWCDVVLHTAVKPEPFGRVIVEAMASGRVVVSSNVGGPREIIRDEVDGILVPPDDREALVATLRRLLHAPDLVGRMAAAARVRAESFSARTTGQKVAAVLEEVCNQPGVVKSGTGEHGV